MNGFFTVEQPCPQCGAPVTIEEADRLFQCGHCRARLYISGRNSFRFCLPRHGSLATEEIFYVPYWHLRGVHCVVVPFETKCKVADVSVLASGPRGMPPTLGVRAQAMTLLRAAEGREGKFLRPALGREEVVNRAGEMIRAFAGLARSHTMFHRDFLGEAVSLVYSPVYLRDGSVWDGVLKRPLFPLSVETLESCGPFESADRWRPLFVPALCPNCGWDLPGDRKSVALFCAHCSRAWHVEEGRFSKLSFGVGEGGGAGAAYLPFWRMEVDVEGGPPLRSRADLVRFANLPVAPRASWESRAAAFWVPAIMTSPSLFMRLVRQISSLDPEGEGGSLPVNGELLPVTLGRSEAEQSVKFALAELGVPKTKVLPALADIAVRLREARVVYLPFDVNGQDLVHHRWKVTVNRRALRP